MTKSRVTAKFQVTIPKDVREKTGVRSGEVLTVEALSEHSILLKRFADVRDPIRVLVGRRSLNRSIPIEELEEAAETR